MNTFKESVRGQVVYFHYPATPEQVQEWIETYPTFADDPYLKAIFHRQRSAGD